MNEVVFSDRRAATRRAVILIGAFAGVALFAGELIPPWLPNAGLFWISVVGLLGLFGIRIVAPAVGAAFRATRESVVVLVCLTCAHLTCGPVYYRCETTSARVAEFPARTPVPGAVVQAKWILRTVGSLEANRDSSVLYQASTRTDAGGAFTLDWWGPRVRPPFTWLSKNDPVFDISAPGRFANEENSDRWSSSVPRSQFSSRRASPWNNRELWVFRWKEQIDAMPVH